MWKNRKPLDIIVFGALIVISVSATLGILMAAWNFLSLIFIALMNI